MSGCLETMELTRRSLVDQVIERLSDEIAAGRWPVGSRIPAEPELVGTYGVARNTMREAIRALAHVGVLEVRHGDGTFVRASSETDGVLRRWLDLADVLDVLTVRRGLEVEAARLAAERRTDDDLARLTEPTAGTNVERAADFHTAVVEAAHNPVLVTLYRGLAERTVAAMHAPGLPDISGHGHTDLVAAIRDRDPDRAADLAARHLQPLIDAVRARLGT